MPYDGTGFATNTTPVRPQSAELAPRRIRWLRKLLDDTGAPRGRRALPETIPTETYAAAIGCLSRARALIERPENWLKKRYSAPGGRYCAMGALQAVAAELNDYDVELVATTLLKRVANARGFSTVENMNDRSTHLLVLDAFDEAAALARSQPRLSVSWPIA